MKEYLSAGIEKLIDKANQECPFTVDVKGARAAQAALVFIDRLNALYSGGVRLRECAVYRGNKEHIELRCTRCETPFSRTPDHLLNKGHGCSFCDQGRIGESTRLKGISLRTKFDDAESKLAARRASKAAYQKRRKSTAIGKAEQNIFNGTRRLLETNAPELVFLDGIWHEVDRKETWRVFSEVLLPSKERKEIQELYLEAQYLTETTGVVHHVDHIQPLSKGGEHRLYNLQILTARDNLTKRDCFGLGDQEELARRLFT